MGLPRIHLAAPASSCRSFLSSSRIRTVERLFEIVQDAVGPRFEITGDADLVDADEDELRDGRRDDARRAEDLQAALGDDGVVAIVALRGGAWLTRILPRIDFDVLDRRAGPVALFGFSELTTLLNIVGAHPNGRGVYDNTPAFLPYGLQHYARSRATSDELAGRSAARWARSRAMPEFRALFADIVRIIEGKGTERALTATLVRGRLPDLIEATFVGGNLTVFMPLIASLFSGGHVGPRSYGDRTEHVGDGGTTPHIASAKGRWLVLEDYNEKLSRIDRLLALLTLAGYWEHCEGVLLGNFHRDRQELSDSVAAVLAYHLPKQREVPVLVTEQVGHVWPVSPLPLHLPVRLMRSDEKSYAIEWPAAALQTTP